VFKRGNRNPEPGDRKAERGKRKPEPGNRSAETGARSPETGKGGKGTRRQKGRGSPVSRRVAA
jgi:hypothetical protein